MVSSADVRVSSSQLASLFVEPGEPLVPALMAAAEHPERLRDSPMASLIFEETERYLADAQVMPWLTYSLYWKTDYPRLVHKPAYWQKRGKMSAMALDVLFGNDSTVEILQDYLWSTCEETTWVPPQHRSRSIDLFAAGTGFDLAEILIVLGERFDTRVVHRVKEEIERRIFTPYIEGHEELGWYRGHNNWNGVCNSAVGAMFLLLEPDETRLAQAIEIVLEGLNVFLETAFEDDGASSEGVGYWHYGLSNFICFAEMLRHRTQGEIDLLATERMKQIAQYPLAMMLSPGRYFCYSDGQEQRDFYPGIMQRLAERTGVEELTAILTGEDAIRPGVSHFHQAWRNLLWWDGNRPTVVSLRDRLLADSALTRLVAEDPAGVPVVLAAKAGHNGVSHNHNDVGSFVLHVDGETVLCDPGSGLYDRYNQFGRYENVFANSYGHSVPVIGDHLQSSGKEFGGQVTAYVPGDGHKRVEMALEGAYDVPDLTGLHRSLELRSNGTLIIEDVITFAGRILPVKEVLVTWCRTVVSGRTALLIAKRHVIEITIEEPSSTTFHLEVLEEASKDNQKPVPLKRLSFVIASTTNTLSAQIRVRMWA